MTEKQLACRGWGVGAAAGRWVRVQQDPALELQGGGGEARCALRAGGEA